MESARNVGRLADGQSARSRPGREVRRSHQRAEFQRSGIGITPRQTVPTIQQVVAGRKVSIVLKADQGTGVEVQGVVAETLTRGNHPRGIKVRLQDGRVGRVQRVMEMGAMATTPEAQIASRTETWNQWRQDDRPSKQTTGIFPMMQNSSRASTLEEAPSRSLRLSDYVKKNGKKQSSLDAVSDLGSLPLTDNALRCPVCESFEGDEVAVSHHVESHFT